jgi:hypothetical protein
LLVGVGGRVKILAECRQRRATAKVALLHALRSISLGINNGAAAVAGRARTRSFNATLTVKRTTFASKQKASSSAGGGGSRSQPGTGKIYSAATAHLNELSANFICAAKLLLLLKRGAAASLCICINQTSALSDGNSVESECC